MRCEICRKEDPDITVLLPIKQADGRFNALACIECSVASGHYCQTHDRAHLGFEDGTSACIRCIEDLVEKDGERIAGVFAVQATNSKNYQKIKEVVDEYLENIMPGMTTMSLADLPLVALISKSSMAQNITRPLVTYSIRKKIPLEEAITKSIKNPNTIFG